MSGGSSSADMSGGVARRLVEAVCLEADRGRVLADLAAGAGPEPADQVAVVLAHQPVTQAVLVDVLAELGLAPEATAAALDLEPVDVELLLAAGPAPEVADEVDDAVVIRTDAPTGPAAGGSAAVVATDPVPTRPETRVDPAEHATGHAVASAPRGRGARRRRLVVALAFFVVAVAVAVGAGLLLR